MYLTTTTAPFECIVRRSIHGWVLLGANNLYHVMELFGLVLICWLFRIQFTVVLLWLREAIYITRSIPDRKKASLYLFFVFYRLLSEDEIFQAGQDKLTE